MIDVESIKSEISDFQIEKYKKHILNMLLDFDEFLNQNNIHYSLMYGTLLGAVRHQGFIPWDDDIDIIIERSQFLKLCSIIKEFKPEKYQVVLPLDDNSLANPRMIKIYDRNTCLKEYGNTFYEGAFIDVFTSIKCKKRKPFKCSKYRFYTTALMIKNGRIDLKNATTKTAKIVSFISKFIPKKFLKKEIKKMYYYDGGEYWFSSFGWPSFFCDSLFSSISCGNFEGKKLPIFSNYDVILSEIYGDYMKLPPENKRNPHHLECLSFDKSYLNF